jgi:hypothetical protein
MNDALGNSFMVEVGDLLAKDEVFEERAASLTRLERVLVVVDPETLICRQVLALRVLAKGGQVLHLRVPVSLLAALIPLLTLCH